MKKPIVFVENMNELGAGTRGSSLGFDALEKAALKFGKHLFNEHPKIKVTQFNHHLYDSIDHPFAKHIDGILKVQQEASDKIAGVLKDSKFPIVISGDHSNGAASIAAIRKSFPNQKLGVLWIDAHADLHSPYTTPSGNVHGMPLSIALSSDNADEAVNDINDETKSIWNELKSLGGNGNEFTSDQLVFWGVRDTEAPEDAYMKQNEIRNFTVEEVRHRGMQQCLTECKTLLKDCDLIYISFDVDSMDCNLVSRGTGTPVENGFSPEEANEIVLGLANDNRLVCFEMVEVNPLLDDRGNKMAETSVRLLDKLLGQYKK